MWPLGHVGHVAYSFINMLFISTGIFDDKLRPQILSVGTTTNSPLKKGNAKRGVSPCLKISPCDLDLWPWKSIGFQILLRSKYVPSLVKIHLWPMTLKINRVPDSPKDYVCIKFGQNPLKDLDSRVFTRMLCSKNLTLWHWPLTLKINRVPDSPKD